MLTEIVLFQEVAAFVTMYPARSGALLRIIAEAMHRYEKAQEDEREGLADRAIQDLLSMLPAEKLKRAPAAHLVRTAFHQFPNGLMGHCALEEQFWNRFLDRAPLVSSEFLQILGPRFESWWTTVVLPAVAKKKAIKEDSDAQPA